MLALLYDVHGNLPALEAVIADAEGRGADRYLLGGDYALFGGWPAETLSLEQDLIDLAWHQKEFQRRRSFAYTVVNHAETQVQGSVYVNPTPKRGHDAVVYFWVRQSELGKGLDARLSAAVRNWIEKEWPFKQVAYPGRDIEWEAWRAIPDEKR